MSIVRLIFSPPSSTTQACHPENRKKTIRAGDVVELDPKQHRQFFAMLREHYGQECFVEAPAESAAPPAEEKAEPKPRRARGAKAKDDDKGDDAGGTTPPPPPEG